MAVLTKVRVAILLFCAWLGDANPIAALLPASFPLTPGLG